MEKLILIAGIIIIFIIGDIRESNLKDEIKNLKTTIELDNILLSNCKK